MSKLITAFTEIDYPKEAYYPGYINISETNDKMVTVTVRETGSNTTVAVDIPLDEYCRILRESLTYLHSKGFYTMDNETINISIDIQETGMDISASIYVKDLINLAFSGGLCDSSNITNLEVVNETEFVTEIAITHAIVRGIGYTSKLEAELTDFLTPIVEKKLKDMLERMTNTPEDERKWDHSLIVLKQRIDNAIDKDNTYRANELLDLYATYKSIVLGLS